MNVTLLAAKFKYIRLGMGKVHACESGLTCCGRPVASDTIALLQRSIGSKELCGRCYASLRTYIHGQVKIEREVEA